MQRILVIACLLTGSLVAAFPGTGGAAPVPDARDPNQVAAAAARAEAELRSCATDEEGDMPAASFYGRMQAVPRTRRMWMRFTLLERVGTGRFGRVQAPGLEVWRKSRPGVRSFGFLQRVRALRSGGDYRALVRFRWYGRDGRLIRRSVDRSTTCRQGGPAANLRIAQVSARPGPSRETVVYSVDVRNAGGTAVEGAEVALAVDGAALDSARVGPLEPDDVRTVQFTGPVCHQGYRTKVDSAKEINESDELDNVRRGPCPPVRG